MSRPLVVITQSGLGTSLFWWRHMHVDGDSLVLLATTEECSSVVVAQRPSEDDARELFDVVSQRIALKARRFDARESDFVSRNVAQERSPHVHEGSKEGR
jgi:hypothetical protein